MPGFNYDRNGRVKVYVDGACRYNGQSNSIAGVGVFFNQNHPMNLSQRIWKGYQTNQTAEVQAARKAVEQAHRNGIYELHVYSDSEYTVKGITEWIHTWRSRGWRNSKGNPVANLQHFLDLENAIRRMNDVHFTFIRAHTGIYGNEAANKLAQDITRR